MCTSYLLRNRQRNLASLKVFGARTSLRRSAKVSILLRGFQRTHRGAPSNDSRWQPRSYEIPEGWDDAVRPPKLELHSCRPNYRGHAAHGARPRIRYLRDGSLNLSVCPVLRKTLHRYSRVSGQKFSPSRCVL